LPSTHCRKNVTRLEAPLYLQANVSLISPYYVLFVFSADLMTARIKAKQAESSSDLNDYDDSKKRKTKKPVRVIDSDASLSSEPEESALDLFMSGEYFFSLTVNIISETKDYQNKYLQPKTKTKLVKKTLITYLQNKLLLTKIKLKLKYICLKRCATAAWCRRCWQHFLAV
jgi:hypothetical protein